MERSSSHLPHTSFHHRHLDQAPNLRILCPTSESRLYCKGFEVFGKEWYENAGAAAGSKGSWREKLRKGTCEGWTVPAYLLIKDLALCVYGHARHVRCQRFYLMGKDMRSCSGVSGATTRSPANMKVVSYSSGS